MTKTNPKVDAFITRNKQWPKELQALRKIALASGLTEELKWRQPCYTCDTANILILQPFKDSCALMFFKGALLKDAKRILERPGENSQAARRVKFTSPAEIAKLERTLKAYIKEAIQIETAGLKVQLKKSTEHKVPAELQAALKANPALKTAFAALTPGRQRAYLLHFSAAKQSATRTARIKKCTPRILKGKGLND